ncbi:hypothetical protein Q3W71_04960 [Micromonospora sp. C28SCA-DRY-2]|uniref:hypothetical protein n=1 Tax=Micromonospora sp. C28SCA-DRY-2 TaxID=3059522 RepID=UPI002674A21B|nr:hypothetical protein [Micromonospora sp. C28SCA-DRY-2]MDO3701028.1 hypothetical protein [Micromonospora sp. C28SCA-DRY-2]
MVTGPIQQPSTVFEAVRPHVAHRAGLAADVHALACALAGPPAEPRFRELVALRLAPVRQGFAEHVQLTEGPSGLYAELLAHAPRLYRGVRLLTREHDLIAAALAGLQEAAELPGMPVDALLDRAALLLRALARHRRRGADLLWQAYQTDLGGET